MTRLHGADIYILPNCSKLVNFNIISNIYIFLHNFDNASLQFHWFNWSDLLVERTLPKHTFTGELSMAARCWVACMNSTPRDGLSPLNTVLHFNMLPYKSHCSEWTIRRRHCRLVSLLCLKTVSYWSFWFAVTHLEMPYTLRCIKRQWGLGLSGKILNTR